MLVSANNVFRSTLVVLATTLLILPLIRTAKIQSKAKKDTHKVEEFLEVINKTANNSLNCIDVEWIENYDSIEIQDNLLSDPIQVLNLVLPGKQLKNPISDESLIAWTCNSCKSNNLYNPINEWFDLDTSESFPFNKNYTSFVSQLELQSIDSMPQRLFSFSTSAEPIGNGRFSGGVLSLLLLEKKPTGVWRVKSFNPAVMYQGSFGKAVGVTAAIHSKEFGNILLLNCPSIEASDVEGCNSYVEDSYLINGNDLELITRIPRAQKVCKNSSPVDALLDFPMWSAEMKLSPISKSMIGIELEVDGMYMVASELNEKWRYMGLLNELPLFLQKKFPDKFKQLEQPVSDGPIAKIQSKDFRNLEQTNSKSTADSSALPEIMEPASLKGFCIPYKAKIVSQIAFSVTDGKMILAPWKIQIEAK